MDLNGIVAALRTMLEHLTGGNIVPKILPPAIDVLLLADISRLEQVILNLVLNARDAMTGGGTLRLSAAREPLDEEQTRLRLDARPGQYGVLTVTEAGTGTSEEVLPHIYEFFTTRPKGKGTGLELATAYGIVARCGGFVMAQSHFATGTCFLDFSVERWQPRVCRTIHALAANPSPWRATKKTLKKALQS